MGMKLSTTMILMRLYRAFSSFCRRRLKLKLEGFLNMLVSPCTRFAMIYSPLPRRTGLKPEDGVGLLRLLFFGGWGEESCDFWDSPVSTAKSLRGR